MEHIDIAVIHPVTKQPVPGRVCISCATAKPLYEMKGDKFLCKKCAYGMSLQLRREDKFLREEQILRARVAQLGAAYARTKDALQKKTKEIEVMQRSGFRDMARLRALKRMVENFTSAVEITMSRHTFVGGRFTLHSLQQGSPYFRGACRNAVTSLFAMAMRDLVKADAAQTENHRSYVSMRGSEIDSPKETPAP